VQKLDIKLENNYYVSNGKQFIPVAIFGERTIKKAFDFAYAMSFGKEGQHRDYRTGGNNKRKKGEIFINTFQGKLSEIAIYYFIKKLNESASKKLSKLDFDIHPLGIWDDTDITLDNIKISVKSTSNKGNLLLLETKDWNENGEYIPNKGTEKSCTYDYFVFVRIEPDGKKIMTSNKLFYADSIDENMLWDLINAKEWKYDIAGYVEHNDLVYAINNNFIIPQGAMLNKWTKMDAENYYIQSGDMKDFQQLIISL